MAREGILSDIHTAVNMGVPERLPVFMCSEEADVKLCNSRYDRYNSDPAEMARVQVEAVERFGYDWVWLQVDDCIEFEPLGIGVEGEGDILPATCEYLSPTEANLEALRQHGYRVEGRMSVLLEAIGKVKTYFGDSVCVVGRTAAPFSSVTLAFGMSETLMLLYDQPEFVSQALEFFEDYQIRFGLDQIEAGADAIWLGDCNASGHLISPEHYRSFASDPARRTSLACQNAGGLVFYHASEEKAEMISLQADLGVSCLSVGPGIGLSTARDTVAGRTCLLGNVDPIKVLANGTPDDVELAVRTTIEQISVHGGHILNSGEMVPRDTPAENIHAFVKTAHEAWLER